MIKGKKITDATSDDSPASLQAFSKNESRSRELGAYFVKACLLVVIVYLLSLALPKMPSPVVALFLGGVYARIDARSALPDGYS